MECLPACWCDQFCSGQARSAFHVDLVDGRLANVSVEQSQLRLILLRLSLPVLFLSLFQPFLFTLFFASICGCIAGTTFTLRHNVADFLATTGSNLTWALHLHQSIKRCIDHVVRIAR